MRAGQARLAIDCGSASTSAVVAWPDGGWAPLLFDGEPELPSAVLLSPDGAALTGHQAWQAAATVPGRFIPSPRQPPDQRLNVAGTDVDPLDLVAATLRRVAQEAQQVAASDIEDVRLVVPAGWGPRRRTWMRHAAHRGGLSQPTLIEAPVAVAEHLLATGVQLPVGSFIAVCDVGAGAEVSVLRRGPAGFEVLATLADTAAGGTAIDDALAALLAGTSPDQRDGERWALMASVRTGKHALADHVAVTIPQPQGSAIVLNTGLLEQAAHPILHRAAQLTTGAIAAAEIRAEDLAGVYCVGGVARMPLLEKVLTETAGITPTILRWRRPAGQRKPAPTTPPPGSRWGRSRCRRCGGRSRSPCPASRRSR